MTEELAPGYQWPLEEEEGVLDPDLRIRITDEPTQIARRKGTKWLTFFNTTTGVIRCSMPVTDGSEADQVLDGEDYIKGFVYIDDGDYYIDPSTEVPTLRPLFEDVITITDNTISGLPNPTRCFYYNTSSIETDGTLELEVDEEETVIVILQSDLYKQTTVEVHCVPA